MLHELVGITNNKISLSGEDLKDKRAPGNVFKVGLVNILAIYCLWISG